MAASAMAGKAAISSLALADSIAVESTQDGLRLLMPDGSAPLLRDAAGRPMKLPQGTVALRLLRLGPGLGLLILDEVGAPGAMLVDCQHTVLGYLSRLEDAGTRGAVTAALHPILAGLLDRVRTDAVNEAAVLLGELDPKVRARLLALYNCDGDDAPPSTLRPLHDARSWFADRHPNKEAILNPYLAVPRLQRGGQSVAARYLPLPQGQRANAPLPGRRGVDAVVAWEEPSLRYVAFRIKHERGNLWFWWLPDSRRMIGGQLKKDAPAPAEGAIHLLLDTLITLSRPGQRVALAEATRVGLVVSGHRHFGHAIFDEMQAIDKLLERRAEWTGMPVVYVIRNASGVPLYGDTLDLYPEFAGALLEVEDAKSMLSDALSRGAQIVRIGGRRALRGTRDRLTALALRHGETSGLAAEAAAQLGEGPERPPCLVIGLRLTNRNPIDFEGFCLRLTRRLVEEFGQINIILDGINRAPGTDDQATQVVNGGAEARIGNTALDAELAFVEAYTAAVADLPVTVVNNVGIPIRDNLFWLSRADYFVAPNGAGLAKLRWALDVPGFVLTSRVTLEYCTWARLYADTDWMDPPFTPMHLTEPDEVEDVPPDPPRVVPPARTGTPFPDRFVLDEARVIPRIMDLLRAALAAASRTA